ncbi:MAG: aminopeptidase P family protein [Clostridium sp.]|nr:aminopeptidase P family protein [Clostridium sp.]
MKNNFFVNNRNKLGKIMKADSIAVFFAGRAPYKSADDMYAFTPNRNFYYLSGIEEEKVILMMWKLGDKLSECLFIEERDEVMAKWVGETISVEQAESNSGIDDIRYLKDFNGDLGSLMNIYGIEDIYLDLERQEVDIPASKSQEFANTMLSKYPYVKINNVYKDIAKLRTIKCKEEVDIIRDAIDITYEGIKSIWKNAIPGMMEYEIEAYFNFELNKRGIKEFAFDTIAASGKNATVLHYSSNNTKTQDNELMLLDLGAQYQLYNADISRTFPLNGKFTERQKQVYNIVLKANEEVMKAVKPGVTLMELQNLCKSILAEGCKSIGLIKEDSELSKYYFHGVSHPLGLDTHDVGSRGMKLEAGMIITDEPGLYIEEEGIGIRIEDDILVTENGYENLSQSIIKSVEDIESFMSNN